MVKSIVAIDGPRVRFSARAFFMLPGGVSVRQRLQVVTELLRIFAELQFRVADPTTSSSWT